MPNQRRCPRGFTLVELLVVLGIITILSALSIPAISGIMRSSRMTGAGSTLGGQLNVAQQYAMSRNCEVEVRLYQLPEGSTPSATTPTVYRAIQSFAVPTNGSAKVPITKVIYLPDQICIMNNVTYSSILQTPSGETYPEHVLGTTAGTALGPYPPASYNYYDFHFKPDGSTDLDPSSAQSWFISLVNERDPVLATGLPANFVTLQINATSGRVSNYRPN